MGRTSTSATAPSQGIASRSPTRRSVGSLTKLFPIAVGASGHRLTRRLRLAERRPMRRVSP